MNNEPVVIKKVVPKYVFIRCDNCSGYGAKGNYPNRIVCPSCGGTGDKKVEVEEEKKEGGQNGK